MAEATSAGVAGDVVLVVPSLEASVEVVVGSMVG